MTDLPPCQAASELRRLTDAALSAVAPDGAVLRHLHLDGGKLTLIDESGAPAWSGRLDAYRRIRVLGAGKGAAPMAAALENLLGDRISDGLVIVKYGHDLPEGQRTRHIRIKEGGHPVPDEAGAAAAGEIVDMARDSREDDLVLCTFTGGASALTPALHPEIPLADMQRLTCMLLECGATIHEINTLRKHLSRFSGGSLVRAAFPATVLGLIVSDVVGDDLDVIASGPTVPDPSTFADCLRVVEHYGLRWKMPQSIWAHIEGGLQGLFHRGHEHVADAPLCLLAGGETTVTIRGSGKGGRNQEMALAATLELADDRGIDLICVGTDGTDGPTDAAGGYAFSGDLARLRAIGLHPKESLDANDSYPLLLKAGTLLRTGPTRTNVMDMAIMLVRPK